MVVEIQPGPFYLRYALTVIFALAGSLLCALTFVPVLASLLLATAAGIYTTRHVAIDTDSSKLFSP